MEFANKREHTLWLIEQGGATNESIEETVGISNKSRGTISVSYTHLDVYKRQVRYRSHTLYW